MKVESLAPKALNSPSRPLMVIVPMTVLFLTFITTLMITVFYSENSREVVIDQALDQLGHEKTYVETFMDTTFEEFVGQVLILGKTQLLLDIGDNLDSQPSAPLNKELIRAENLFRFTIENRTDVLFISLLDSNGNEITSIEKHGAELVNYRSRDEQNKRFEAAFSKMLYTQISRVHISDLSFWQQTQQPHGPKIPVIYISTPFIDRQGNVKGIVVFSYDMRYIFKKLSFANNSSMDFYLTDHQGIYFFKPHSDPMNFDDWEPRSLATDFPQIKDILENNTTDQAVNRLLNTKGEETIGRFFTFGSHYLDKKNHLHGFLVAKDVYNIFRMDQVLPQSILVSIALSLLAWLITKILIFRLINPLNHIIRSALAYEVSGQITELPLDRKDEFGALASAIRSMIVAVERRSKELHIAKSANEANIRRLNAILTTAADGIITIDEKGIITNFNLGAEKIFGYYNHEVVGSNIRVLMPEPFSLHHDGWMQQFNKTGISKIIGKPREESRRLTRQLMGKRKNGETFPIDLAISKVETPEGTIFCGITRDISESRKIQAELVKAKEQAESVARLKSDFLATVSHEIRTPMNAIQGMLGILERSGLPAEQQRYVSLARGSSTALLGIINDVLDYSKIEANRMELEEVEFNLVSDLYDTFTGLTINQQGKSLEYFLDISPDFPDLVIGDSQRVRQIVTNLLGNAIKFTEHGAVSLKLTSSDITEQSIDITISVKDTGIGIPENSIDQLFESFTQADSSTTRKYGGTGLGLAIVKQLCDMMKGSIDVFSEEGSGSEFIVKIPLHINRDQRSHRLTDEEKQNLNGKQILILTRTDAVSGVLVRLLASSGAVLMARSIMSPAVLEELADIQPDLIMLDSSLVDSSEAIANILKMSPSSKLLMLAGIDEFLGEKDLVSKGLAGCLHKIFTPRQLYHCVNSVLCNILCVNDLNQVRSEKISPNKPLNLRILLVDDIRVNLEITELLLKESGITSISTAINGQDAINQLKSHGEDSKFDLILMDCLMPVMDGYEATRRIREGEAGMNYKDIPVIAMTANALPEERLLSAEAGMNDHLTKPVEHQTLFACINRLVPSKAIYEAPNRRPASTPNDISIWDKASILSRVRGNETQLVRLIHIFLESLPENMQKLEQYLQEGELTEAANVIHGIKGTTSNMGGVQLLRTLQELESACKTSDSDSINKLRNQADIEVNRLVRELRRYVDESGYEHGL